ncbi:transposable element Tcb1 transposase [Trichonephila clavipes]|nr:transposable element Tcb1 transposase [Trichonephila clavipes]
MTKSGDVLFKMSGDKFNNKKSEKGRKRCTTSVSDGRTTILCFSDKRVSWISIRRDISDAGVSVSSKTVRSRLTDVRLKGKIPRKKPYLNLQQRLKGI